MTGKRIILHLGAPKTATSSLQHAFLDRRAALEAAGIVYPVLPFKLPHDPTLHSFIPGVQTAGDPDFNPSHAPLFWTLQHRFHPAFPRMAELPAITACRDAILDAFRNGPARVLVLSYEGVFLDARTFDLGGLAARLAGIPVTLAIALRPPESLFHSLYATHIMGLQREAEAAREMPVLASYLRQGFAGIIDSLVATLSPAEVRLMPMQALTGGPGPMLARFLDLVGVAVPEGVDLGAGVKFHSNPTMPPAEVLFLRRCNRAGVAAGDHEALIAGLVAILHERIRRDGPLPRRSHSFLPRPMQKRLAARQEADRAALLARYGTDPLGPPEPPLPLWRDNSSATDAAILTALRPHLPAAVLARVAPLLT